MSTEELYTGSFRQTNKTYWDDIERTFNSFSNYANMYVMTWDDAIGSKKKKNGKDFWESKIPTEEDPDTGVISKGIVVHSLCKRSRP